MLHKIYTVRDSKTEAYLQPFFCLTRGQALRSFTEVCKDTNHNIGKYPEDFALFELGTYDDSTAVFNLHAQPENLGLAAEYKSR